ncbi:MAG: DUF4160 domain-containing protein [Deltaproteobacteria bacterium]|nr:DUF4160 domain-containing protein [Deltaproteobacteria bacterium]
MGRVAAFSINGLDLWFNSNDHLPPHFHAEKPGEWEVRVFIRRDGPGMFETCWGKGPSAKMKKELRALTEAHREALETEWAEKVNFTAPGPER